jgi:hypothetical protein
VKIERYWFWFGRGVPVTVHLETDHKFMWTRILGLQVGDWFFGAIKGRPEET